jgi:putative ABC transport system substrate-binding protein
LNMRRREFITLVCSAAVAWPLVASAQNPSAKVYRVGLLGAIRTPLIDAWLAGLRDHGWSEGKDVIIDYRYYEGRVERLPALVAELIALRPDLIVTSSPQPAMAVHKATATIPVIFVAVADPVALGLIDSLSHPGGNVTGLATLVPGDFIGKQIGLLRELIPSATKIAILANPTNQVHRQTIAEELPLVSRTLGIALPVFEARTPEELDVAFASAAGQQAEGMNVLGDPLVAVHGARVIELADRYHLPTIHLSTELVSRGGLIAYGPNFPDLYRRAAGYVDRVLKGANPSDIPVEQPTKFELAINLKTAKTLGLSVPPSLLARADEVIE